jgi:sulfite exporter TauE/SafE
MIFLTAFLTGLLGSFHCAGMCGPIALATPVVGDTLAQRAFGKLLYNLGRIVTYALLGAALGAFGVGLKLAGMQQSISIAAGVLIIAGVVLNSSWLHSLVGNPFRLFKGSAKLFQSRTYTSLFLIGIINGLLPCGFVYIALIGAVATQQVWQGAAFMVLFGLGTLPMMFGVSMVGQFLSQTVRSTINKTTPYLAVLIGCLFILRGLNLGIPYVSPQVNATQTEVKDCCKPSPQHIEHQH